MKYDILVDQVGKDFKVLDNDEVEFFGEEKEQGFICGEVPLSKLEDTLIEIISDAKITESKIKNIYIGNQENVKKMCDILDDLK
jgi:hypothetical protein